MKTDFTQKVIQLIKNIPEGKVLTYGAVAVLAGNPRAARQVSRILHSCSKKYYLPWHRVINAEGRISLPLHNGYAKQKLLLKKEGVQFDQDDHINLDKYFWYKKHLKG
jgi:methylated-DNA-protein-cysteine methyltransferase-like protein